MVRHEHGMSAHPLRGPQAKIERAKKHVRDLEAEIGRYLESRPYEIVIDDQSESGHRLYKMSKVVAPPIEIALTAGDAIHNARSALDLLFWQLVRADGKMPNRSDAFPISDSAEAFRSRLAKVRSRISNEAATILAAVGPHKGGNDALWRLHQLDIADKHHLLYLVGGRFEGVSLPMARMPGMTDEMWAAMVEALSQTFIQPADRMFPLEDGDVLFRDETGGPNPDYEANFHLGIAFGQGEVLQGEPVSETLIQLIAVTEEVIDLFAEPLAPDNAL